MKTLLVVTGPQGSGNHLFSKILAQHPNVFGWKDLLSKYWIAHDQEPFAEAWHDHSKLRDIQFEEDFAVTSISCPYAYKGEVAIPDIEGFIMEALDLGYKVKLAVIGRDATVLKFQQERVRDTYSLPTFLSMMSVLKDYNPVFISTELLYLYREYYVRSLSDLLGIPVTVNKDVIEDILMTDPNAKYFTRATGQPLDAIVRKVSGLPSKLNNI